MKYEWLNDKSRKFLSRDYLREGQTAEERIREIAEAAEKKLMIPGFANKFEDYMSRGWYSLSSPIWANYGLPRGLPCSCNGCYISDTMDSILSKTSEIGFMTKYGAGTSAYYGDLRARGAKISTGGESTGPVHFMEMVDCTIRVVSQSNIRRGSCAVWLPVEHPDILDFLRIRSTGHKIQDLSFGVCISDEWMRGLVNKDKDKLKIWGAIIKKRFESGYPYIFFTDNANNKAPEVYKKAGKKIHASNLCTEIMLSSDDDESFVCVLSSINLLKWDEWKDTDAVKVLTYFLDTVTEEYIEKTANNPHMRAPRNFCISQRAIGLGVLGWHSLLQSKRIPFESMQAKYLNTEIFKHIDKQSLEASQELALAFGEPPLMKGTGQRMSTRMAIAPTKSSSHILGQMSPSIEPIFGNISSSVLAKGVFTYKNPILMQLLKDMGKDTPEVLDSILHNFGSVQHLSFLSENDRNVFKTFQEISPKEIVIQAASRQHYIDQGQSLNLFIHPDTPPKEVSQLLIFGWEQGIKSFYYQLGRNQAQEVSSKKTSINECTSCEG